MLVSKKGHRSGDAAVHVAFRGEVHHRIDFFLPHQGRDPLRIADVHFDEAVVGRPFKVLEVGQVARIGEGIEVDDPHVGMAGHPAAHHVGTDESGAACDEEDVRLVRACSHVRSSSS